MSEGTTPLQGLINLDGQVAIVTGAGMGIGQAVALRLAEAGAAVVLADVQDAAAQDTAARIRADGGRAEALHADAASVADAQRVVSAAQEAFGRLDILVNNAGIFPFSPLLETTEALWDRVLDVNLKGAFFYSQAAGRRMVEAGRGGRIVNVASVDALFPSGNLAHYDASKGGMVMLTKALAKELGAHGIRVNAVAPGGVDTPGARQAGADVMARLHLPADTPAAPPRSLLGRYATADEMARVVFFLCTPLADFLTGSLIVADGGYLLI
jgi:glucose 1-dehydrogenase/2-deoxy-D-gluconate 3-dehydrogenase